MAGAMYGKIAPEMDEGGDAPMSPMGDDESDDTMTRLTKEAFPDMDWTPERLSALERLILHCSGMGDEDEPPSARGGGMGDMMGDKGKKATLLLALGGPSKRK